jgi:hypothetical protein
VYIEREKRVATEDNKQEAKSICINEFILMP